MNNPIVSNVLAPMTTRIGALVTGYLVGIGAETQHADWVGTGTAGLLLIGVDLMLAWFRKRSIQQKARLAWLNEPTDTYREGPLK